jgi:hypothetical protein
MDRRLGVKRPSTPPFNLNSAVDRLLKSEFDIHRAKGQQHPLQKRYKIDATPANHELLEQWRINFTGVQYLDPKLNWIIYGAIDDLWQNSKGEYVVVDYKATAKTEAVTELGEAKWHDAYRRQIEFYQWLLRRNGLNVSNTAYWVYCTGDPTLPAFDQKIEFRVHLISYEGNDYWVEPTILKAYRCLKSGRIPASAKDCEYCKFIDARLKAKVP